MEKDVEQLKKIKCDLMEKRRKLKLVENLSEVKSYLALLDDCNKLQSEEVDKYIKIKHRNYDKCKHLYICTNFEYESNNKRYYNFGCIKCGLDTKYECIDDDLLTFDEKIMKYYMLKNNICGKVSMDVVCDLSLARSIFKRLKEIYPYEDDEVLIKYFEIALLHMRMDNGEERKKSRIKRLNLDNDFNRW